MRVLAPQLASRALASPSPRRHGHPGRKGPAPFCAAAQAAPRSATQKLTLHMGDTTVSFPLNAGHVTGIKGSIDALLATFAEKQAAERPKRWPSMEYTIEGEPGEPGVEHIELFCNPNAHATAFDARVLITLRSSGGVALTSEARLSNFKADIEAYLEG